MLRKGYFYSKIGSLLREVLFEVYKDNTTHPYNQNITRLNEITDNIYSCNHLRSTFLVKFKSIF